MGAYLSMPNLDALKCHTDIIACWFTILLIEHNISKSYISFQVTISHDTAPEASLKLLYLTSYISVFLYHDIITAVEITENIVNTLKTIEKEVRQHIF